MLRNWFRYPVWRLCVFEPSEAAEHLTICFLRSALTTGSCMNSETTSFSAKPFLKKWKWPLLQFVDCHCWLLTSQTESLWGLGIADLGGEWTYTGLLAFPLCLEGCVLRHLRNWRSNVKGVWSLDPCGRQQMSKGLMPQPTLERTVNKSQRLSFPR